VFTHGSARRLLRPVLTLLVSAGLLLGALAAPAVADTPKAWEHAPHVSGLQFFLVLLVFPLCAAGVITLLVLVPSLIRDKGYEPGQSWRGDTEWFGGPTKGIEAADAVTPQQIEKSSTDAGGTSGRW
jgi:hypothetical protein